MSLIFDEEAGFGIAFYVNFIRSCDEYDPHRLDDINSKFPRFIYGDWKEALLLKDHIDGSKRLLKYCYSEGSTWPEIIALKFKRDDIHEMNIRLKIDIAKETQEILNILEKE
jgi:hypothetical protein